eukprot:TRINITY_DN30159_c0_g1_i7.p1 TRINITY_DN30159_c0_g1~~TRINITY_DN30159_c0_g1_i7.p1  ORF type:complete len:1359 (-),score=475.51 TRINITY_DN30159_c0_g1_i7:140-4216(-)
MLRLMSWARAWMTVLQQWRHRKTTTRLRSQQLAAPRRCWKPSSLFAATPSATTALSWSRMTYLPPSLPKRSQRRRILGLSASLLEAVEPVCGNPFGDDSPFLEPDDVPSTVPAEALAAEEDPRPVSVADDAALAAAPASAVVEQAADEAELEVATTSDAKAAVDTEPGHQEPEQTADAAALDPPSSDGKAAVETEPAAAAAAAEEPEQVTDAAEDKESAPALDAEDPVVPDASPGTTEEPSHAAELAPALGAQEAATPNPSQQEPEQVAPAAEAEAEAEQQAEVSDGKGEAVADSPPEDTPTRAEVCAEIYRCKIKAVYVEHNPHKMGDLDGILHKYAGVEHKLYFAICKKYGLTPEDVDALTEEEVARRSEHNTPVNSAAERGSLAMEAPEEEQQAEAVAEVAAPAPDEAEKKAQAESPVGDEEDGHDGNGAPAEDSPKDAPEETPGATREPDVKTGPEDSSGSSPSPSAATAAAAQEGNERTELEVYKEKITAFYEAHNPTKLAEIDVLLSKYLGRERELYEAILRKYARKPYLVDNSQLKANTNSLAYRLSKNMDDRDPSGAAASFGSTIMGIESDGWLEVDGKFLPMSFRGVPVVIPAQQQPPSPQNATPLPASPGAAAAAASASAPASGTAAMEEGVRSRSPQPAGEASSPRPASPETEQANGTTSPGADAEDEEATRSEQPQVKSISQDMASRLAIPKGDGAGRQLQVTSRSPSPGGGARASPATSQQPSPRASPRASPQAAARLPGSAAPATSRTQQTGLGWFSGVANAAAGLKKNVERQFEDAIKSTEETSALDAVQSLKGAVETAAASGAGGSSSSTASPQAAAAANDVSLEDDAATTDPWMPEAANGASTVSMSAEALKELETLRAQMEAMKSERQRWQGERQGLIDEGLRMSKRMHALEERAKELVVDVRRAEARASELERAKTAVEAKAVKLSNRAATAEATADEQKSELRRVNQELGKLRAQLHSAERGQQEGQQASERHAAEQTERVRILEEKLQAQTEASMRERAELFATNQALAASLEQAQSAADSLESQYEAQLSASTALVEDQRRRLEDVELEFARATVPHGRQVAELEEKLVRQERELSQREATSRRQAEEALAREEEARRALEAKEAEEAKWRAEREEEARQRQKAHAELVELRSRAAEAWSARETAEQRREATEADLKLHASQREAAERRANEAEEKREDLARQLRVVQQQLHMLQQQAPTPSQSSSAAAAPGTPSSSQLDRRDSEGAFNDPVAARQQASEVRRVQMEVSALRKQRDDLTREGSQLQAKVEALRREAYHAGTGRGGVSPAATGGGGRNLILEQKFEAALQMIAKQQEELEVCQAERDALRQSAGAAP